MQIWTGLEEAVCETPTAVACGYFDGLHIGHAAVIGEAVAQAQALGVEPGVFTFTLHGGHPAAKPEGCELLTEGEKYRILEAWGVRRVLCPDFSQFQSMSPEAFVEEILCRRLRAAVVCCGEDFRFGSRASGDVSLLRRLCAQRGVQVAVVPEVDCGGSRVSSTRIRALLGEGRVEEANQLLGRAFGYDFIVIHGKRLGRTIDSPTINQRMPVGFVRLRHGVYASVTLAQGRLWPSVTNVGLRPVIAHIERYQSLMGEIKKVENLIDQGAYVQVNAGSIKGIFGHKTARWSKILLKKDLVHLIATDAHNEDGRAPKLSECARYLMKKYGEDYTQLLLWENPCKVIENKFIQE